MLAHNIINGEIRTVLYGLRQNARWSDEYVFPQSSSLYKIGNQFC